MKHRLLTIPNTAHGAQCDCNRTPLCAGIDSTNLTAIYIELTGSCNNRCDGCGAASRRNLTLGTTTAPLPNVQWAEIARKLPPSIQRIHFTGGEPTLRKDLWQCLEAIREDIPVDFALFTNGRWLDPSAIIDGFKPLSTDDSGILISLHGQDAVSHEAFTKISGSFAETLANIKRAIAAGIDVDVSCILTQHNCHQIRKFYKKVKNYGVRRVFFNRYVGKSTDSIAPPPNQLKHALAEIEALRLEGGDVGLSVSIPQCFHPSSAIRCGAGINYLAIDPAGNVRPCVHAPLILGNLLRESLDEILHSDKTKRWREYMPDPCRECAASDICGGGCKADALLNNRPHDTLIRQPFSKSNSCYIVAAETLHPKIVSSEISSIYHAAGRQFTAELAGQTSLKEIGTRYGQAGLDLIGKMVQGGAVILE